MKDKIGIQGIVHIYEYASDEEAKVKERMSRGESMREISRDIPCTEYTKHNMLMNRGLKKLATGFVEPQRTEIFNYIAIGNFSVGVRPEDYMLASETVRLPITNLYLDEQTGISIVAETFIGTQEANFNWKELGLYQGGSDTAGSGVLFSKIEIDVIKNNQSAKTVMWEIIIKEGGIL